MARWTLNSLDATNGHLFNQGAVFSSFGIQEKRRGRKELEGLRHCDRTAAHRGGIRRLGSFAAGAASEPWRIAVPRPAGNSTVFAESQMAGDAAA
jgi:hypothetical protein